MKSISLLLCLAILMAAVPVGADATVIITAQPTAQTTAEGEAVTLTIEYIGFASIIKWYKNASEIPNANSTTLVIDPVTIDDSGMYMCSLYDETNKIWVDSEETAVTITGEGLVVATEMESVSPEDLWQPSQADAYTDEGLFANDITAVNQVSAVVPTTISFNIDPNQPVNYNGEPEGAFIASPFEIQNYSENELLQISVASIVAHEGSPTVIQASAFTDTQWKSMTATDTKQNIAFGFVAEDAEEWVTQYNMDAWCENETLLIGELAPLTSASLRMKAKYGLAWAGDMETITYDVIFLCEPIIPQPTPEMLG